MDGPWLLANNSNSSVSRIFLQWLWRLKSARESSAATKAEMPCCAPFLLANSSKCYIWRIFLIIMKIFKLARKRKPRLPLSVRRSLLSLDLSRSQEWKACTIKPAKKSQLLFLSRFPLFIASQTGRQSRPLNCIMLFYEYTSLTLA